MAFSISQWEEQDTAPVLEPSQDDLGMKCLVKHFNVTAEKKDE